MEKQCRDKERVHVGVLLVRICQYVLDQRTPSWNRSMTLPCSFFEGIAHRIVTRLLRRATRSSRLDFLCSELLVRRNEGFLQPVHAAVDISPAAEMKRANASRNCATSATQPSSPLRRRTSRAAACRESAMAPTCPELDLSVCACLWRDRQSPATTAASINGSALRTFEQNICSSSCTPSAPSGMCSAPSTAGS